MKGDEAHLSGAINQSCFSNRGEVLGEGIARIRHVSLSAAVLESISLLCAKTLDKKGILLLGNEDKVMQGRGVKRRPLH